jgi:peroxiredoxin
MDKHRRLNFDDPAPDAELLAATGETIRLSSLWAERTLLLAFARHFGCPQCKVMLGQLRENRRQIEEAKLAVAIVTQAGPEAARAFCAEFAPETLCLCDPERTVYHAYGLERGNLLQTALAPKVIASVAKAGAKGYHLEMPPSGQDAMQMPGIFVIGMDGRVRLPYYYDDIADHPPLELLLHGFLSTPWDKPLTGPLGKAGGDDQ